jgi:cation:H+ antiporter
MIIVQLLVFAAGAALLVSGAESLVRGGSRLAAAFRLSPLVIGLTVVAFGTSLPELAVSVLASLRGSSDLAIGNVIGSNVFNVLAVLGPAALISPIAVQGTVVRREVPVMLAVTALFVVLVLDRRIGRGEGVLLCAGILAYTALSYVLARREEAAGARPADGAGRSGNPGDRRLLRNLGFVALGIVLLVAGGRLAVAAAIDLARDFGVTERVIALTLVAGGTSLPELATSLVAAFRKETDIAVGNIVGSNVFNILGILGVSALIQPLTVAGETLRLDLPVMVLASLALFPIVLGGHRISRAEGGLCTAGYVLYIFLVLRGGL